MVISFLASIPALPAMPTIFGLFLTTLYGVLNICIEFMVGLLPVLSFNAAVEQGLTEFVPYLGGVSYFIPISQMIVLGGTWVIAIASYYIVRTLMKLLHVL